MAEITKHLTWDNFNTIITESIPGLHRVIGSPPVDLFVDPNGARIGLRVPYSHKGTVPPSPLLEVRIERVTIMGEAFVEITTGSRLLYAEFYSLMTIIADKIQSDKMDPLIAFEETLDSWRVLLRSVAILTEDQQLGLLGELWMLERLLMSHGPRAVHSWVGPLSEEHDFRLTDHDFEVKSTRSLQRVHIISSLQQLQNGPGRRLFLLSLQYGLAPTDLSLPRAVQNVRALLSEDDEELATFNDLLTNGSGYRDEYAVHYPSTYFIRAQPVIVPIDEFFPRITPSTMAGIHDGNRISDVKYRVNVEGMGFEDGSNPFCFILPAVGGSIVKL